MSLESKELAKPSKCLKEDKELKKEEMYQLLNEDLQDELKQQFIQKIDELYILQPCFENLREYSDLIQSPEYLEIYQGLNRIRRILSDEQKDNPRKQLIQIILELPALDRICETALNNQINLLVYEALGIIVLIGLGDQDQRNQIVNRKGIEILIKAVESQLEQFVGLAVQGIGNFSSKNSIISRQLVQANVIPTLINFANAQKTKNEQYYKSSIHALSNIIRSNPSLKGKNMMLLAIFFSQVIIEIDDEEILIEAMKALQKINEVEDNLHSIYQTGVTPKLISLLTQNNIKILIPALRIVGDFLTGNYDLTEKILKHGILQIFEQLLNRHEKVCWCLSNISAGTPIQVKQILKNDSLMLKLFSLLKISSQFNQINKEIGWLIGNALSHGQFDDIKYAVNLGLLQSLKLLLISQDKELLSDTLDGIDQLFNKSQNSDRNDLVKMLTDEGITEIIQNLLSHSNQKVNTKAQLILNQYCH